MIKRKLKKSLIITILVILMIMFVNESSYATEFGSNGSLWGEIGQEGLEGKDQNEIFQERKVPINKAYFEYLLSQYSIVMGVSPDTSDSALERLVGTYNEIDGKEENKDLSIKQKVKKALDERLGSVYDNNLMVNTYHDKAVEEARKSAASSTDPGGEGSVDKAYFKNLLQEYSNKSGEPVNTSDEALQALVDEYNKITNDPFNSTLTTQTKVRMALEKVLGTDSATNIIAYYNKVPLSPIEGGGSYVSTGDEILSLLGGAVDGIVGVVFYIFKLIPLLIGKLLTMILNWILVGTEGVWEGMTIDKILFNEVPLISIDFFEPLGEGVWNQKTINGIRENIAIWYTSFRNLAVVGLAIMVLYVGIRMAISSVADEKAKYKKMLVDWLVSLLLLFVLHYIIVFVIKLNDSIVEILSMARDTKSSGDTVNIVNQFGIKALTSVAFVKSFTYTFIYFMMCIMTFIFMITYIKRMITIAFLIMISPIITITYSIDKMGDGKSQALNKWFKEFVYNILLQPFQCVIYLALVQTSLNSLDDSNLGTALVCILMIIFVYEAEKIIKEIFHFNESKSVATTIGQAAMVTTALGLISKSKSGKTARGGYTRKKKETPKTKDNKDEEKDKDAELPEGETAPEENGHTNDGGDEGAEMPEAEATEQGDSGEEYIEPEETEEPAEESSGESDNSKDSNKNNGKWKKRIKKGLRTWARTGTRISAGLMFGSAGAATGNLTTTVGGLQADPLGGWFDGLEVKEQQRQLAKSYREEIEDENIYKDDGQDKEWVRKHSKDLLTGDAEVEEYEKEYYKKLMESKDFYIERGLSEESAITAVDQDLSKIQNGYIGELSSLQVFKGKIKGRFSGKSED